MRTRVSFGMVGATIGLAIACGSQAPPKEFSLQGQYLAQSAGPFADIDFVDGTHYSARLSTCADGDDCAENGTYAFNEAHSEITLTDTSGKATTFPFAADEAAPNIAAAVDETIHLEDSVALVNGTSCSALVTKCQQLVSTSVSIANQHLQNVDCSPACDPTAGDEATRRACMVSRAALWATARLPYCQSPNNAHDNDRSCAPTCTRVNSPQWNAYRSDCSGLVSWSWGLQPPGSTTTGLASSGLTQSIQATALEPGDALLIPGNHTVLFAGWAGATPANGQTVRINLIEEPSCSAAAPFAHTFQTNATLRGNKLTLSWFHETFAAVRFNWLVPQWESAHAALPKLGACPTAPGSALATSGTPGTEDDGQLTCSGLPDGLYCGSNQVKGDPRTLYQCSGGTAAIVQYCSDDDGCTTGSSGAADACSNGTGANCKGIADGQHCGADVGGDAATIYQCSSNTISVMQVCQNSCSNSSGTPQCDVGTPDSLTGPPSP